MTTWYRKKNGTDSILPGAPISPARAGSRCGDAAHHRGWQKCAAPAARRSGFRHDDSPKAEHEAHDHDAHEHGHGRFHEDDSKSVVHRDNNLRAAYLHVLADAATSILAITALLAGRFYGWVWMDPIIGIVGAAVIAWWSCGLMRDAGAVLVDMVPDSQLLAQMRSRLEVEGDRIADIHLWRVGPSHNAAALTLISDTLRAPDYFKSRLEGLNGLSHVTVEGLATVPNCRSVRR